MKIANFEVTKDKIIIAVSAGAALLAVLIFVIFYAPALKKMTANGMECRKLENEVRRARTLISQSGKIYGDRTLISEDEVGWAMEEITKHGKAMGINFISIKPSDIKEVPGTGYKVISIDMRLEATDRQFSEFIGAADTLKKGLLKIKGFDISPKDGDPSKLDCRLLMDMYISGRKYEQ